MGATQWLMVSVERRAAVVVVEVVEGGHVAVEALVVVDVAGDLTALEVAVEWEVGAGMCSTSEL
ncbi:hypothetical protein DPMN_115877 [Dreissena polymorpha]|uniref:Uncharacterized protein n=1 Tax=Dreissena polymorpha TaxID=45954 RepID=A0A9D4KNP5_DREPO|nr:hypothetical protein DPMN_115877 [Dreissena polymorpha]